MSAIGMPSHLLALFAPRPPLERLPLPKKRKYGPYTGICDLLSLFETTAPPPVEPFEAPKARKERLKKEKADVVAQELKAEIAKYDPFHDPERVKTADPRKTLFVGRLSFETTEKKLLNVFEHYGEVRDIRLVADAEKKPRGYAFIEFKHSDGLRAAYRDANEKLVDGRKILVDYERGRTVKKWLPRRLGGGEGPPRKGVSKKDLAARMAERRNREMGSSSMMGRGGRPDMGGRGRGSHRPGGYGGGYGGHGSGGGHGHGSGGGYGHSGSGGGERGSRDYGDNQGGYNPPGSSYGGTYGRFSQDQRNRHRSQGPYGGTQQRRSYGGSSGSGDARTPPGDGNANSIPVGSRRF